MNDRTQAWLDAYRKEVGDSTIQANAWQFGTEPDELARLVIEGKKNSNLFTI